MINNKEFKTFLYEQGYNLSDTAIQLLTEDVESIISDMAQCTVCKAIHSTGENEVIHCDTQDRGVCRKCYVGNNHE